MSEVKRWRPTPNSHPVVAAADFDAVVADRDSLREQLLAAQRRLGEVRGLLDAAMSWVRTDTESPSAAEGERCDHMGCVVNATTGSTTGKCTRCGDTVVFPTLSGSAPQEAAGEREAIGLTLESLNKLPRYNGWSIPDKEGCWVRYTDIAALAALSPPASGFVFAGICHTEDCAMNIDNGGPVGNRCNCGALATPAGDGDAGVDANMLLRLIENARPNLSLSTYEALAIRTLANAAYQRLRALSPPPAAGHQPDGNADACRLLREIDEYLSSNIQNAVWSGSRLHQDVKRVLRSTPPAASEGGERVSDEGVDAYMLLRLIQNARRDLSLSTDEAEAVRVLANAEYQRLRTPPAAGVDDARDAARYRWFKSAYSATWYDAVTGSDGVSWSPCWELRVYLPTADESQLDVAIDAAMKHLADGAKLKAEEEKK